MGEELGVEGRVQVVGRADAKFLVAGEVNALLHTAHGLGLCGMRPLFAARQYPWTTRSCRAFEPRYCATLACLTVSYVVQSRNLANGLSMQCNICAHAAGVAEMRQGRSTLSRSHSWAAATMA